MTRARFGALLRFGLIGLPEGSRRDHSSFTWDDQRWERGRERRNSRHLQELAASD